MFCCCWVFVEDRGQIKDSENMVQWGRIKEHANTSSGFHFYGTGMSFAVSFDILKSNRITKNAEE